MLACCVCDFSEVARAPAEPHRASAREHSTATGRERSPERILAPASPKVGHVVVALQGAVDKGQ